MAIIREKGTIAFMSDVQSGMSQNGNPWYRQTIVVDVAGYNGSFRKVALQATGNVVGDLEQMQVGDKVEVSYQVTAREYQGRWYNNVDLYKVEMDGQQMQQTAPAYQQMPQTPAPGYPQSPAPVQPAYHQQMPQRPAAPQRGRMPSQPLVPPGTPTDPQDGDLPWA